AVHPGYGFLSERPELPEACAANGITFVGPPGEVMRRSGDKLAARDLAASLGIPTGGGTDALPDADAATKAAADLDDFPLILKASAGGGGRGMRIVRSVEEVGPAFNSATEEALRAFGDGRVYLERYVERARHVEVQILADTHGTVLHLGERDCSTQRRHQKLIEEAPAAGLDTGLVSRLREDAVRLCQELGYVGAGTVEFLVDLDRRAYLFLELNARIQVEHPVSELVTGVDIVRAQLRIAAGEPLKLTQGQVNVSGHAIECRINAEDPDRNFLPSPGTITEWVLPTGAGIRVDTHVQPGTAISPYYDSMIAKLIVHAPDRPAAIELLDRALAKARIEGVATTVPLVRRILAEPAFIAAPVTTRWLEQEFLT
ncbi:MAG TPA: biotin carboxylase N-terminal domain-containing protein, partial [Sporichthya sp.]|nr:biotin carboxylase N-terminal domain-containing protein [Sporichthya sp.]